MDMLTLGQASCLVLGYPPNEPGQQKKAIKYLCKCGLIAVYLRGNDPFRPMAIGMEVYNRDPYNYISYSDSPRILEEDASHSQSQHNAIDDSFNYGAEGFLADSFDSISAYWSHLQKNSDLMTIGYAMTSSTSEIGASRVTLLQLMIDKLYLRGKCVEVFVSPCCLVNQPILERDCPRANETLALLKGCQGDITDLTLKVHDTQRGIRLVIIDYAGLSTSPEDIQKFLRTYKNIKEIAIGHGSSFEILSRLKLLKTDSIRKFK